MVSKDMLNLGRVRSAIRELFEFGRKRAAIVGSENVYDFSIGNPSVPPPAALTQEMPIISSPCRATKWSSDRLAPEGDLDL